jgi:cytochrome bd-type quinol oxidase subunit 2
MSRRILLLVALIWLPFLILPAFAAFGDTSYPHIAFHVLAIPMLVGAVVLTRRLLGETTSTARRWMLRALLLFVPLAVVGHVAELATAIARFAQDGFVNRNTADVWESGPHFHAANITIPSMMLAMVTVLALAVTAVVQARSTRSHPESHPPVGSRL